MYGKIIVTWLLMEILINIIFAFLIPGLGSTISYKSFFKGVLERLFLIAGMLTGYPHVIIAFGALKIGTRLHVDENKKEQKVSNDYFLIGNFMSLLFVIIYIYICIHFFEWPAAG